MGFFSGKGDGGETSLLGGKRARKSSDIFELIGTLDELSAYLGLAISLCDNTALSKDLAAIQPMLSELMGIITGSMSEPESITSRLNKRLQWVEDKIHAYGAVQEMPNGFTYSGKTSCGAVIDIARTITRRAERIAVRNAAESDGITKDMLAFLNRLSSLMFVLRLTADRD